jgi:hypothetical protein
VRYPLGAKLSPNGPAFIFCCIVIALGLLAGCGSQSRHELQYVGRYDIGPAYTDSSINVAVFRQDSVLRLPDGRHLVGYYDPEGYARIAVLGTNNTVERGIRILPRIEERLLGDGHCGLNLGLSSDGVVHMIYGAHGTRPYYAAVQSDLFTGASAPTTITAEAWPYLITYPQFHTVGGELQCWFRVDPASEINRVRYDPASKRLRTDAETILRKDDAVSVYMNQLATQGQRVALSWMYRLPLQDNKVINKGLYFIWSEDGGNTWKSLAGSPAAPPVPRAAAPALQDMPLSVGLLNQTSTAFGADGRHYVTYYAKDSQGVYQIHLATVDLKTGTVSPEAVSDNATVYELLGRGTLYLPLSRPQIAVSEESAHLVYRQDNDLVVASRPLSGTPGQWTYSRQPIAELGAWEPTYSRETWQAERRLLVYVQAARQGELDTNIPGPVATASLYEFR